MHDFTIAILEPVYAVMTVEIVALTQLVLPRMDQGSTIINARSDAAVEVYEGWGGYGSSKAALEQLTKILAAEHPQLRIYAVDPGDKNRRTPQEPYPGADISDRPPPEASVPVLLRLVEGDVPSGRYKVSELLA